MARTGSLARITFVKTAPAGNNQAWLTISNGDVVAHAAVYALVK